MKRTIWVAILAMACGIFDMSTASAQEGAAASFAEKQFYGNRIKAGSVLLNGAFQRTGFAQENVDGLTGRLGLGVGVGLAENIAFSIGYQQERSRGVYQDGSGQLINGQNRLSAFQAGFRFLPNTLGGFIQPYFGFDVLLLRDDVRTWSGNEIFLEDRYLGFNLPVGVIVWISTFMSLSIELLNLSMLGSVGEDVEAYNAIFNAELSMLNPTFGVSFLINARKP